MLRRPRGFNLHAEDIADEVRYLSSSSSSVSESFGERRLTCALRGMVIGLTPPEIYWRDSRSQDRKVQMARTCQSKQMDNSPRPSLPLVPPKTRENAALFGLAKQKIENPVRSGNIHSGKSSQINILSTNESEISEVCSSVVVRQLTRQTHNKTS